jgi:folate receptor
VENVLEDYNVTKYVKECPVASKCVNYTTMYGSGENLCNKMWGSSYKYVKKNGTNCMKFWFTPGSENPNGNVLKEVSVGGSTPTGGACSVLSSPLLLAMVNAVMVFN